MDHGKIGENKNMTSPFFDIMMIVAQMCISPGALLTTPDCNKNMVLCIDKRALAYSAAELQDSYVKCLKEEAWKK